MTLKSSNDSERPLGVISGFSISNFSLKIIVIIIKSTSIAHNSNKLSVALYNK